MLITKLYKKVKIGIDKKYYICGIPVYTKKGINVFYKKYKKLFKDYDNIYVLNSNIGEAYLVFKYFANAIKSDKTLFVATKPYHIAIIKTFLPTCNYILEKNINLDLFPRKFQIDGKSFIVLFNHDYYITLERDMREMRNDAHYYKRMKDFFKDKDNFLPNNVNLSNNTQQSLYEKISKIKLNFNNFVFIAPEANSCLDVDDNILSEINNSLQNAGIDVFWNINRAHENFKNYKTCFLTLQEALLLCSKAKAIISLRSGLAEFLTEANTPTYVLYSKLKNRTLEEQMSADKVFKGFTLSELPNYRNNIKEYLINNSNDYKKCFNEILGELCQTM